MNINPYQSPVDSSKGVFDYSLFWRVLKAALWLMGIFLVMDICLWLRFRSLIQKHINASWAELFEWFILG